MALQLDPEHWRAIAQAVVAGYPREACGLLVGHRVLAAEDPTDETDRTVTAVVPVANAWDSSRQDYTDGEAEGQAHSQRDRYWIDPADLLAVQRQARQQGLEIIGIYHSHPDHPAVPSECDRALAWPVYSYVIVSVVQGRVAALNSWRLDEHSQFQPEAVKMIEPSANKAPFLS
ncbi:M67 family metallopeptidase [Leptolyngbya sp. KIOST-1]|uniref:M67 family metallopeptidase n=1 Tax=Leptolyngbya sp. KIOST-1 TaxID=1229172 RepID=UPI00056C6EEC|nr:M67 family metallopeptidase [Leptolyngbya sp. KIOST-1]